MLQFIQQIFFWYFFLISSCSHARLINAQQFYSPLTERLQQAGRGTNPRIQFNYDKSLLILARVFYKTFVKKYANDNLYWTYTQQFKIIEYGGPGVLTIYMRKPEIFSLSLSLCTLLDSEAFWSFFYFWFGFLCAQVSYGNCERTETWKICNFDPKVSESC